MITLVEEDWLLITVYYLWNTIAKEIMGNVHDDCPFKGVLVPSNISMKYIIMYKIGVRNWEPSFHELCIIPSLASYLYHIGTRETFDFGDYVFE